MAVFLGVSRSLSLLNCNPGDKSFCCVYAGSQPAQPSDLLLLYFPVGVSHSRNGISQIYRISSSPQLGQRTECGSRGMASVDTELLLNLTERITMKDLKRDNVLRRWSAVGRNMQGATFVVDDEIWPALCKMIITRNPEARAVLKNIKT